MTGAGVLLFVAFVVAAFFRWRQLGLRALRARREELIATPLPEGWRCFLEMNVPLFNRLPGELKQQVEGHAQILLEEKNFEGHDGLEMTDEIRVTIAGQASFLLLNQKEFFLDTLRSVIVYPSAYKARTVKLGVGGIYTESEQTVLGQSWDAGVVVLAWDNTRHSAANPNDGHNLVLHEFAHQLDQGSGATDGTPILQSRDRYGEWRRAMSQTYRDFLNDTDRGQKTVMDDYGATNPAEFFAVATETFFEKPRQLKKKRPELYDELCTYYRTNPLKWAD